MRLTFQPKPASKAAHSFVIGSQDRLSRCLAIASLFLVSSCASPASHPLSERACFDPKHVEAASLLGDGKLHVDLPAGVSATSRGSQGDFEVYDFRFEGRPLGGVYLGNAPSGFSWPEEGAWRDEEINGLRASTATGRTSKGASRETRVEVSVVRERLPSGQEIASTTGWPGFAHFWYRELPAPDAELMNKIIASTTVACGG